jgi:hypothetical protein
MYRNNTLASKGLHACELCATRNVRGACVCVQHCNTMVRTRVSQYTHVYVYALEYLSTYSSTMVIEYHGTTLYSQLQLQYCNTTEHTWTFTAQLGGKSNRLLQESQRQHVISSTIAVLTDRGVLGYAPVLECVQGS